MKVAPSIGCQGLRSLHHFQAGALLLPRAQVTIELLIQGTNAPLGFSLFSHLPPSGKSLIPKAKAVAWRIQGLATEQRASPRFFFSFRSFVSNDCGIPSSKPDNVTLTSPCINEHVMALMCTNRTSPVVRSTLFSPIRRF